MHLKRVIQKYLEGNPPNDETEIQYKSFSYKDGLGYNCYFNGRYYGLKNEFILLTLIWSLRWMSKLATFEYKGA